MHFPALLEELDRAAAQGTSERSTHILASIADLFALKAENCTDRQVDLFDEIFVRLATYIEKSARASLAGKLADHSRAPAKISRLLAEDDEISVAGPVRVQALKATDPERSKALDRATLIAIATTKSQKHLLALSRRSALDEAVTDILVDRGDTAVVLSTVQNAGARFSHTGFGKLVDRSQEDDALASRSAACSRASVSSCAPRTRCG